MAQARVWNGREAVMALPASIRIGPFDFAIERWAPMTATANNRLGEFSSLELAIRIRDDLASSTKAVDTFLHEVFHAIFWVNGIEDGDKEERVVNGMGTAWTQVYRDNPWLLKWIERALHHNRARAKR